MSSATEWPSHCADKASDVREPAVLLIVRVAAGLLAVLRGVTDMQDTYGIFVQFILDHVWQSGYNQLPPTELRPPSTFREWSKSGSRLHNAAEYRVGARWGAVRGDIGA